MANWKHTLDIHAAWIKADQDGDFKPVAKEIVDKLNAIDFGDFNEERDGIVECFENLIFDKFGTIVEFHSLMVELFDFGDTKIDGEDYFSKLMWVKTF